MLFRSTHAVLEGQDETGRFRTSYAMEYPPALREELALSHLEALQNLDIHPIQKVRAPPIDAKWMDPKDWRLLFKSSWARQEHQNVLEGRTIVNLGRHLARSSKCWGQRYLVLTDSLVCLGTFAKGRSSSFPLLRLGRRLAMLRMVLGIRMSFKWVPTALNVADGPSRVARIGDHPEDPGRKSIATRNTFISQLVSPDAYRGQG